MRQRLIAFATGWLGAAVTTLITLLLTFGGTVLSPGHRASHPIDLVGASLVLVASLATLPVRRWPTVGFAVALAATGAYFWLGYPTDSSWFIGLAVTAFLSARASAYRRALLFAVLMAAVFGGGALGGPVVDRQGAPAFGLILIAALGVGQGVAEWRGWLDRRAHELHEQDAARRITEERVRIARELHDVVSHSIAMINVQAGAAAHVIDERPEEAKAALLAIRAASRDALRDLRGILGLMRDTDDDAPRQPAPLLAQVPELVDSVRRAGCEVSLEFDPGQPVPAAVELAAYRVVQEALTNVLRHAPGAAAAATVRREDGALVVEVVNAGSPQAAADGRAGAGQGLAGMRERVLAAGGSVEAGPRPEGGWRVLARFPVAP